MEVRLLRKARSKCTFFGASTNKRSQADNVVAKLCTIAEISAHLMPTSHQMMRAQTAEKASLVGQTKRATEPRRTRGAFSEATSLSPGKEKRTMSELEVPIGNFAQKVSTTLQGVSHRSRC